MFAGVDGDRIVIFDNGHNYSKVSLFLLLNRKPKAYEYSVNKIQENIRTLLAYKWTIDLQFIPSHCGITGNHRADFLANSAHELNEITEYPLELQELNVMIKRAEQRQWKIRWELTRRDCALGLIKPDLEDWTWCRHEVRSIDVALTRLRNEAVRLQKHLFKLDLVDTDVLIVIWELRKMYNTSY